MDASNDVLNSCTKTRWLTITQPHKPHFETPQILAGDPKQLGPTTRSPLVSQLGLGKSLQEHLMDTRAMYDVQGRGLPPGRKYVVRLSKNYRSHQAIIEIPSRLFYDEALEQRGDPRLINSMLEWEMLPGSSADAAAAGLPISPPPSKERGGDGVGGGDGGGFPVLFYGVQGEHMHEVSFWPLVSGGVTLSSSLLLDFYTHSTSPPNAHSSTRPASGTPWSAARCSTSCGPWSARAVCRCAPPLTIHGFLSDLI